jgi:uncharacterized protein (DUF2252 family)
MEPRAVHHPTLDERRARGKAAKKAVPPGSLAGWRPADDRPDPVILLEEQNERREQDLVPVRRGRMLVSPFTFYRGAARVMAADLKEVPRAGLDVQLCGDAHLSNFGAYASPERTLVFDLNDFDETLPGPFEYDVLRMAASFTVAARNNGLTDSDARAATRASVMAYVDAMAGFSQMRTLDVWYARMTERDIMEGIRATEATARDKATKKLAKERAAATAKLVEKAQTRDSLQALSKLGELVDGCYRIVSQPPVVVPLRELSIPGVAPGDLEKIVHQEFRSYRSTLQGDRRRLVERFEIIDVARKVVGVGSVGTRCLILLLQGRGEDDPLFLQAKEATASVLEDHLPRSRYQPGARVVHGQRLMQATSDIFLGWTKGYQPGRFLYLRQLRDMKASAPIETMVPATLAFYAKLCGWTLARAHARSGDAVAISAYLGKGNRFAGAVADFSARYADQNERDYTEFAKAVKSGRLQAIKGV